MLCWFHLNTNKFINDDRFGKFLYTQKQSTTDLKYMIAEKYCGIPKVWIP